MRSVTFDIQELVRRSGIPRRTIHFYVQQGVLPPPQGAGLAAHYTEDHLLRLQLIPVLRGQGLRLDQIRARFSGMDAEALRKALEEAQQAVEKQPRRQSPGRPLHKIAEDRRPFEIIPPDSPAVPLPTIPTPAPGWGEQRVTQYHLPGGITISAPEGLSPLDRQRLDMLLQAARRIFIPTLHELHKPEPPKNGPNDLSSIRDDSDG